MQNVLLKTGAEAQLWLCESLCEKTIVKKRVPKNYRIEQLDNKIRKERTKLEAGLLHNAKLAGIRVPFLKRIDLTDFSIEMEFVQGTRVKEAINEKNSRMICKSFGEKIALLHNAGIIHGDLTTSNAILEANNELCILDFGLGFYSTKLEDKAVDLLNLKKTFQSTHFKLLKAWLVLEKAYLKKAVDGKSVLKQLEKVEKRVRYS